MLWTRQKAFFPEWCNSYSNHNWHCLHILFPIKEALGLASVKKILISKYVNITWKKNTKNSSMDIIPDANKETSVWLSWRHSYSEDWSHENYFASLFVKDDIWETCTFYWAAAKLIPCIKQHYKSDPKEASRAKPTLYTNEQFHSDMDKRSNPLAPKDSRKQVLH